MVNVNSVKQFISTDGLKRLEILERDDGLYEFVEESIVEGSKYEGIYWLPTLESGLYQTLDHAERDAVLSVPWLSAVFHHKTGDSE